MKLLALKELVLGKSWVNVVCRMSMSFVVAFLLLNVITDEIRRNISIFVAG